MCSRRWDTPVIPVCSLREPTRYQTLKLTTGAFRTSLTSTVRPFGSTVSCTPAVSADAEERASDEAIRPAAPAARRPTRASRTPVLGCFRRARTRGGRLTSTVYGPGRRRARGSADREAWYLVTAGVPACLG